MREKFRNELQQALKTRDKRRVATMRLILATIKDRDIAARTADNTTGVSDQAILDILARMVRQRTDAAELYAKAERTDLARQETEEVSIINEFLPPQMDDDQIRAAVDAATAAERAVRLKDMGKVMARLKQQYSGQMDFARASAMARDLLT